MTLYVFVQACGMRTLLDKDSVYIHVHLLQASEHFSCNCSRC